MLRISQQMQALVPPLGGVIVAPPVQRGDWARAIGVPHICGRALGRPRDAALARELGFEHFVPPPDWWPRLVAGDELGAAAVDALDLGQPSAQVRRRQAARPHVLDRCADARSSLVAEVADEGDVRPAPAVEDGAEPRLGAQRVDDGDGVDLLEDGGPVGAGDGISRCLDDLALHDASPRQLEDAIDGAERTADVRDVATLAHLAAGISAPPTKTSAESSNYRVALQPKIGQS